MCKDGRYFSVSGFKGARDQILGTTLVCADNTHNIGSSCSERYVLTNQTYVLRRALKNAFNLNISKGL